MRLYVIRHGDPDYANDSLTEQGRTEAAALAKYLKHERIGEIFSSPLGRARRTAEYTAALTGLPAGIEDWTRELKLPTIYGGKFAAWNICGEEARSDIYLSNPADLSSLATLPLKEIEELVRKLRSDSDAFLERHGYVREGNAYRVARRNTKRIAIFCHGGFGPAWISQLLSIPLPLMWTGFFMHTTSVSVIVFDERNPGIAVPRCLMFGALPHLYAEGIEPSQAGVPGSYE